MTNSKLRILSTGSTGFLGHYLGAELARDGIEHLAGGRGGGAAVRIDLDRPEELASAVRAVGADLVLHAAAMASMPACEADPELAWRCNVEATAALVESGIRVLLVSTDLVFDGRRCGYRAEDSPAPLSVYGRSKAAAEALVAEAGGLAVRVPLLFGPSFDGGRGATDMLRRARQQGAELSLFRNEWRTPLHAADAARALVELGLQRDRQGLLQVAGPERVSRFELAERFAALHGWRERPWRGVDNADQSRPADVSLQSDLPATRTLDAMLFDS